MIGIEFPLDRRDAAQGGGEGVLERTAPVLVVDVLAVVAVVAVVIV